MAETATITPPAPVAATPPPAPAAAAPAADKLSIADPFSTLKPAPAKPADKPADGKVAPKADDGKAATAAPAGDKRSAVRKDPIAEQRTRIEQQNTTIAETSRERDDLRRQVEELRKQGGGDTAAMTRMVEELRQKNAQLTGEIAARDYSKHPDFVEKYEKPFTKAADYGKTVIESLQVKGTDGEGNETARDAKWETDFAPIFNLPRGAALRQAKAMFGEDAASVMQQYDKLHELQGAKQQALTEWQTGSEEREQKQRAETLVRQQNVTQAFDLVTKNYLETDAEFQIKPDDKETKELWGKSQAIVDKAYFSREKLAPHELILIDAAVRLRAINEPVLRAKLSRVQAELDDYKARLDEKESSTNGKTRRASGAEKSADGEEAAPWQSELVEKLKAAG